MKIVYPVCCGIDVHKKFVVATIASTDLTKLKTTYQTKRYNTLNNAINDMKLWLEANECNDICMESTGKYWIPVYNILEKDFNITLANPKYVRAIKGKKTDTKDSIWIADLFKQGYVPGSFIPPMEIRQLRELCRYNVKLTNTKSSEKNRIQNSLTVSNIHLASVVSDTFGKTASKIIDYILNCDVFDPNYCKSLIGSSMKATPDEIINSVLGFNLTQEQALKIKIATEHLSALDKCLSNLNKKITDLSLPYSSQIQLLVTTPGITEKSAIRIISEIGIDMTVFSSSKRLCSWAGLTPTNNESAGKKKSTRISRAGVYLKPLLVQCANAAIKDNKNPYFKNKYLKLKNRIGHKKAIVAIARMMLTSIFFILFKNQPFLPSDLNPINTVKAQKFSSSKEVSKKEVDFAIELLLKQGFVISYADKVVN